MAKFVTKEIVQIKTKQIGAEEIIQQLKSLDALPEDTGSTSITHLATQNCL